MKLEPLKSLVIIILMILLVYFIFTKTQISSSELYKLDSDCGLKAISYAKSNSHDLVQWGVLQNKFNTDKGACFAEFAETGVNGIGSSYIFDLTHNIEMAWVSHGPQNVDDKMFETYTDRYIAAKIEAFDN